MTPLEYDPAYSAGVRNLLIETAVSRTPAKQAVRAKMPERSVTHRRQWWVTAATAATLLVATLGVLQLTNDLHAPISNGSAPTSTVLQDPLKQITDRSSELYVSDSPEPILHVRADRTRTFRLSVPAGVTSVRYYLSCTSGSTYAIRTDTSQSGTCRGSIGGFTDEPASQLGGSVTITVPANTAYVLLVIPTPTESYSPGPPIQ